MSGGLGYCNIKPRFKTEKMFSVVLFCVKSSSSNGHLLVKTWRKDLYRLNRPFETSKYQNLSIKISLKKNIGVDHFFALFGSVRDKLQFTVSLNHPV